MNHFFTRKTVILTILLNALTLTLVIQLMNGREKVSQQEIDAAIETVRQDCKLWCLDPSLAFQYEGNHMGYAGKENLLITIETKNDQIAEASYYVIPGTQKFIKIIHNWRIEAIDDGSAAKAKEYTDLTYKIVQGNNSLIGASQIMNVSTNADEIAAYRGKLITLFGAPLYETDQDEQAFTYLFEASDHANHKWLFTAYQGPSGFAIGGNPAQKDSKAAAVAFVEDLNQLAPADFERILFNQDSNSNIAYGCKQKQCYSK